MVLKTYAVVKVLSEYQPSKVYPILVGGFGASMFVPSTCWMAATASPPLDSNVIVVESLTHFAQYVCSPVSDTAI